MFEKIETPAKCEMRSVIHFLNARNMRLADSYRQLCEVYGEHAISDSLYRDGWDTLLKDAKMCMMIRGVADRLWLMKIWCVQWKRRYKRPDDSPFHHSPCTFHRFHGHFTKLCLMNFVFGNCVHTGRWRYGRRQNETAGQCIDLSDTIQWARWWFLEPHSHRGQDIGVARNPWIKAAVKVHIVTNKRKFKQTVSARKIMYTVFQDRTRSACGIVASGLNQCRHLLQHTCSVIVWYGDTKSDARYKCLNNGGNYVKK
jgi:hypothetical protein